MVYILVRNMIETRIGDFEEVIMLIVGILGEGDSYAFRIAQTFEKETGRSVSIGAVHSTLDRLEEKGFVKSDIITGASARGDRRKRIFTITALGKRVLKDAMDFKMSLWRQYPAFAGKLSFNSL